MREKRSSFLVLSNTMSWLNNLAVSEQQQPLGNEADDLVTELSEIGFSELTRELFFMTTTGSGNNQTKADACRLVHKHLDQLDAESEALDQQLGGMVHDEHSRLFYEMDQKLSLALFRLYKQAHNKQAHKEDCQRLLQRRGQSSR